MLTLWLARHGEAVDPELAASDFDRSLTDAGRQRLTESVTWLLGREQPPELILHSPLVRARQTAETIAAAVNDSSVPIRLEYRLSPGIDTKELLRYLSSTTAERIVCVGHQPDMSRCASEMISGGHIQYYPGTIAGLVFNHAIAQGGGQLKWLLNPNWFV